MDSTDATFRQDVIERSHEVPVVVDFWAPWCGPCRQLAPVLEAAVERHGDEVVLVKVNIDENPAVAREYRVQSIPFVAAFRDGKPVGEFVGMQPAPSVESFVNRLVPTKADRLVALGDEDSLREALVLDAGHTPARLALARLLLADGRTAEIPELLDPVSYDPAAAGILARVRLAPVEVPDVVAGLDALDGGRTEQALTHLLDAVRAAAGQPELRDDLRAVMVGAFGELGEHHPLTVRFRKRLAQALY
ncbi:MAG: thioredoxin [Thermoleophilia bacterium]